jgi:hypothetical protein
MIIALLFPIRKRRLYHPLTKTHGGNLCIANEKNIKIRYRALAYRRAAAVSAHEFLSTSEYSVATLAATSLIRTSEPFNRPPLSSEISARLIA